MKISKAVLKAITLSSVLVLGGTYASALSKIRQILLKQRHRYKET